MPINYKKQNMALYLRNDSLSKVQVMKMCITGFKGVDWLLAFSVLRVIFALLGNNCRRHQSECSFSIVCHLHSNTNPRLESQGLNKLLLVSFCVKIPFALPEMKKVEEKRIQWLGKCVCFAGGGVEFGRIYFIIRHDVWSKIASVLAWKSIFASGLLTF